MLWYPVYALEGGSVHVVAALNAFFAEVGVKLFLGEEARALVRARRGQRFQCCHVLSRRPPERPPDYFPVQGLSQPDCLLRVCQLDIRPSAFLVVSSGEDYFFTPTGWMMRQLAPLLYGPNGLKGSEKDRTSLRNRTRRASDLTSIIFIIPQSVCRD